MTMVPTMQIRWIPLLYSLEFYRIKALSTLFLIVIRWLDEVNNRNKQNNKRFIIYPNISSRINISHERLNAMDILVVESYMYFLIILLIVFGIFAVLFIFDILKVQQTKSITLSAISEMSFEIGLQIIRQIEKDEMMYQRAPNTIGNKGLVIDTTCYDIRNTLTTILSTSNIFVPFLLGDIQIF